MCRPPASIAVARSTPGTGDARSSSSQQYGTPPSRAQPPKSPTAIALGWSRPPTRFGTSFRSRSRRDPLASSAEQGPVELGHAVGDDPRLADPVTTL